MLSTKFQFIRESDFRGEDFFRNQPIRNKNGLWRPSLLTDRDEMSNLYRGPLHRCFLPSFGSFGQAVSEEKIFKYRPIRNKNCLWRPCLSMDRDKMSNFIENLPQMLPTKFQFILGKRFQRRRLFRNQPIKNKNGLFVNGSELNEQSVQRIFQGCFLSSFDPFGQINRQYSSYCFLASELSIEKKIKYSKQAAYSQSVGFAINISHAQ